ncbi:aldo/keto reductase [Cuneatibacter caecimuris]|uniref:Aryl-alcohol dehydrogenase-like predicted oxidoreductase n=1 Tax=Cuneatibacter caecimuris TaxID=1796618 RepID=A0A4Q7PJ44_9FIRM|nr:aldo/keto reductase [Cuneatibacter caecimuris]RZT00662.1 aryl-alcohol dehydrogenase-like predicted oxidoreductase [Cuneatibacter caecimuris]
MEKIKLHNTDLTVSEICLGTVNYGSHYSKEESCLQMNTFLEAGGNFLDTALVYGDWGNEKSSSEKIIGQFLKEKQARSKVVLSTKGCHPFLETMHISRMNVECLGEDVERSLRHLQTDYIDLYFLHRDNENTPVEEILEGLEGQVKKGNLRYYGFSNWTLARAKEAEMYAKAHGLKGFVCNQAEFGLADVNEKPKDQVVLENDFYQYHKETQLNAMAYQCQANGYFARRLQGREIPENQKKRYAGLGNDAIFEKLKEFEKAGCFANHFLLNYIRKCKFPAIPICGCRTVKQLEDSIRGINEKVPGQMLEELISLKKKQVYDW